MSDDIVPIPDNVATAPAKAPRDPFISHCPARVALACNAPDTSADSQPIPDNVATAERINQRFALLISPSHSIVASIFIHNAPDPVVVHNQPSQTLLHIPPVFGGKIQEYGAE